MENRKGALKVADIPADVLAKLNEGALPTVNLTEWLAVDHARLVRHVMGAMDRQHYVRPCLDAIASQGSTMQVIRAIGAVLLEAGRKEGDGDLKEILASHRSDSVRCWGAYVTGLDDTLGLPAKLVAIRRFAADTHFGVREIAWMAVRPHVDRELEAAIPLLAKWTADKDPNVRRFASEVTRPRGVWCKHIEALKEDPGMASAILEPLKADPAKYVQDSVANWLNDASKSHPQWVLDLCERWERGPADKATKRITEKALRTVRKTTS